MFDRIKSLIVKEFLQIFRSPVMRSIIFISPVVQVLIFGYAATMDITNAPIAILDRDNSKQSRDIIRMFSYSSYFDIKYYITNEDEENELINKARVLGVIKFNRGFARDLIGNNGAESQISVDGTNSNSSSIVMNYVNQVISNYNENFLKDIALKYFNGDDRVAYVDLRDRKWFNENLESRNYYLPGIIVLIVTIMSLMLSAMAIVREKEIGTIEQLIVSPIRPLELILGKILPYGIIALCQVSIITVFAVLWFGIPFRGSIWLLFFGTLLYLLTTLGAGLFLSTLCSTQQEAMMSVFLINFPATLLSGFAYPIANMPQLAQFITFFNPQRYYLTIIRYIFLKGAGMDILYDEMLALLVIGILVLTLSALRFRKRLG